MASGQGAAQKGAPTLRRPHATDYKALDRSLMPMRMPIVGYRGHLRNTKESAQCYGTSYWRPYSSPTRAAAAAAAFESAKQKALDAFMPTTQTAQGSPFDAPLYDA